MSTTSEEKTTPMEEVKEEKKEEETTTGSKRKASKSPVRGKKKRADDEVIAEGDKFVKDEIRRERSKSPAKKSKSKSPSRRSKSPTKSRSKSPSKKSKSKSSSKSPTRRSRSPAKRTQPKRQSKSYDSESPSPTKKSPSKAAAKGTGKGRGRPKGAKKPKQITFVTGNENKLKEVTAILGDEFPVISKSVDLPELQGEIEDIAKEKCRIAAKEIKGPVMVEDTCLCFNALHGLPGPYIKWFLTKLGHDGLNKLLAGHEDKSAVAVCTFTFTEGPGKEIHVFKGETPGKIVAARGPLEFGWDPVFQPDGFDKTYAELDKDTKNSISHRKRSLDLLSKYLKENSHIYS